MANGHSRNYNGTPTRDDLTTIITNPDGAEAMVGWADSLGKTLAKSKLSTSQIRALFGEVRRIEGEWQIEGHRERARRRLILLKPKMAYRARKERGRAVGMLVDVLDPAVDLVVQAETDEELDDNFTRFVEFFEAILAYHKAHGGN